ncbi:MAG: hypothetical protein P8J61_10350 [Gammaproteobacteria bacterium]|nr:hypothetical protein [Gammaproteobacteria bacterium]
MIFFFNELKRRKDFRVGADYAIVAWLLIQAAFILLPSFDGIKVFIQMP